MQSAAAVFPLLILVLGVDICRAVFLNFCMTCCVRCPVVLCVVRSVDRGVGSALDLNGALLILSVLLVGGWCAVVACVWLGSYVYCASMAYRKLANPACKRGGSWTSVVLEKDELYETTDGVRLRYEGHSKQVTVWMQLPENRHDLALADQLLGRAARSIATAAVVEGRCSCGTDAALYRVGCGSFMACAEKRCTYLRWL